MPSDYTAGDAPGPRHRTGRVTAMVVLGGIAAALIGFQYQFRHLEAYTAAHLYSVVAPTIAAPSTPPFPCRGRLVNALGQNLVRL